MSSNPPGTWYAVFDSASGVLRSITTVLPATLPAGLASAVIGDARPEGRDWNPATKKFDIVPPKPAVLPTRDFMELFTAKERADVERLRRTNDDVASFMSLLLAGPTVDRAKPSVGLGLALLVSVGVLANQARADVIRNG